ncbi:MAG: heavy metal-associated domain-containing protein, partial [Saprospiraceae bacterium]
MNNLSVVAQNTANKSNKEAIAAIIKTVELAVDGMTCQKGCADGIDKKLKTVSGVVKSKTKLDTGIS